MIRFLSILCLLLGSTAGGWYLWDRYPILHEIVEDKVSAREFLTLEIRHSADEIMHKHHRELIKGPGYVFLEPRLVFYPYVMMSIKFSTHPSSTEEGILLWGLADGEMVLDTDTWERTHGYEDCLISHANETDFKIIKAITEAGGSIDRDRLYQRLKVDSEIVDTWLGQCRDKKLIVSVGNRVRMHLQNPNMESIPFTLIKAPLVAKPTQRCIKISKRYSAQQIKKLTEMAFGAGFAIRKTDQCYVPVHAISIQNPDGSILVTHWNALNGKRFELGK